MFHLIDLRLMFTCLFLSVANIDVISLQENNEFIKFGMKV